MAGGPRLFLIWQPFVAGERGSAAPGAVLLGVVLASTLLLGPWLLLIWRRAGPLRSVAGSWYGAPGSGRGICWPSAI